MCFCGKILFWNSTNNLYGATAEEIRNIIKPLQKDSYLIHIVLPVSKLTFISSKINNYS